MSDKRKQFTPEAKLAILKEHLVDKEPVSDVCDKHDIHPNIFYRWQKELFERGVLVFTSKKNHKAASKMEREVEELKKKLANKNEVISELMEETMTLKKNLGEI
jgi:transposase